MIVFFVSRRLSPRSPPKRARRAASRRLRRGGAASSASARRNAKSARAHAPRSTALNSAVAAAFRNGSSSSSVTDKRCATSSFSLVTFLFINRTSRATRGDRKPRNSQSPASSLREHKARHSAAARRLSARRSWIERDRSSASADRCAGKGSAPLVTKKERSSSSSSSSPSSFNSFSFNSDSAADGVQEVLQRVRARREHGCDRRPGGIDDGRVRVRVRVPEPSAERH